MATSDIDVLTPVTYTGTFKVEDGFAYFVVSGKSGNRIASPFTGQVMVQIVSGSEGPIYGYADGGGYTYANLAEATGSAGNWRCTYSIVVNKGQTVNVYPYISNLGSSAKNVGAPVSITFFPVGEHKN